MYFENSLFNDYLWNFFDCYSGKQGRHFSRNLREFDVARSEELEVNRWIAVDIHWLSSQSERAKNSILCFSILKTINIYTIKFKPLKRILLLSDRRGWVNIPQTRLKRKLSHQAINLIFTRCSAENPIVLMAILFGGSQITICKF